MKYYLNAESAASYLVFSPCLLEVAVIFSACCGSERNIAI